MTPMVDLGFLLITFFIFTATLSQPGVTRLIMPNKGTGTDIPESKALTLLLDGNKIYAYEGRWQQAIANRRIIETDYNLQSGIGNRIRQKQKALAKKDDLVVLIKPLTSASYQNIIAALDEMKINNVGKYALLDATPEERSYVEKR